MITLLVFLAVVLLVAVIWNIFSLRKLSKQGGLKALDDERYFELKYKLEFLTASFWVMITVVGLLGYSTLKDAKEEVKGELLNEIADLRNQLKEVKNEISFSDSTARALRKEFPELERSVLQLQRKVTVINGRNILKQDYYIVKYNGKVDPKKDFQRVYFKRLKTTSGDLLPKFTSPPVVLISANGGSLPIINNITSESFDMYPAFGDISSTDFNFLIFETVTFDGSFDDTFK